MSKMTRCIRFAAALSLALQGAVSVLASVPQAPRVLAPAGISSLAVLSATTGSLAPRASPLGLAPASAFTLSPPVAPAAGVRDAGSLLAARGYGAFPVESMLAPEAEALIKSRLDELWRAEPGSMSLLWLYDGGGWRRNADPALLRSVQDYFDGLDAQVRRELPGEEFRLADLHIRRAARDKAIGHEVHTDDPYLSANYVLRRTGQEEGTMIYVVEAGQVRELVVPPGMVGLVSGWEREDAIGIPAPVHSAPRAPVELRDVIMATFVGIVRGSGEAMAAIEERNKHRVELVERLLAAARRPD